MMGKKLFEILGFRWGSESASSENFIPIILNYLLTNKLANQCLSKHNLLGAGSKYAFTAQHSTAQNESKQGGNGKVLH